MKKIIICALLGLVLTAAFSWTARAKQIRELSKPVTELFTISSPVYEGETVANYNMSFPAEYLEGGQRLYFGVRDERNFHAVLRNGEGVELGRVVGGRYETLHYAGQKATDITIAVRGTNCGLLADGEVRGFYLGNESIPSRWCWMDGAPLEVKFRPLSSILFADTFMRVETEGETSDWEPVSGDWQILAKVNPSRSANPFRLGAKAFDSQPAIYLLNLPDWDNYRAEISLRPMTATGGCGMVFDYKSHNSYDLVRLDCGDPDTGGGVTVAAVRDGVETILSTVPGTVISGQWYRLEVRQAFGRLSVLLGETEIANISSPLVSSGKLALLVDTASEAEFDDLDVRSLNPVELAGIAASLGAWHLAGSAEVKGSQLQFSGTAPSFAFMPLKMQEGSQISGTVRWPRGGGVALLTRGMSSGVNSIALPSARLIATGDLLSAPAPNAAAGEASFSVHVKSGTALIEVNGSAFYRGSVPLENGAMMFGIAGTDGCSVSDIDILSSGGRVVLWRNEIFTHEDTMRSWNDDSLHWRRSVKYDAGAAWVNERVFSRRLEVTLNFTETQLKLPKWIAGITFPINPDEPANGVHFTLEKTSDGFKTGLAVLGEQVWELPWDGPVPSSIGIYRDGDFLITYIDRRIYRVHASPTTIPRSFAGYTASGFIPAPRQLDVSSDATFEYLFSSAPTEWRSAAGVWEVLNRWQCDPRWSFFSGDSERDAKGTITDKLALLWWRRKVEGDFTFEMFFGIKMDNARGQKYSYARDVNVSLVSDTTDMNSGYSFILGGQVGNRNNAGSWVTRNGETMPYQLDGDPGVSRFTLYTADQHRFWFHYILTRRGNVFRLELSDQKGPHVVVETRDNDPLPADRLGIWSYDCGLMIARVRVQTSGHAPLINLLEEKNKRPQIFYEKPLM